MHTSSMIQSPKGGAVSSEAAKGKAYLWAPLCGSSPTAMKTSPSASWPKSSGPSFTLQLVTGGQEQMMNKKT